MTSVPNTLPVLQVICLVSLEVEFSEIDTCFGPCCNNRPSFAVDCLKLSSSSHYPSVFMISSTSMSSPFPDTRKHLPQPNTAASAFSLLGQFSLVAHLALVSPNISPVALSSLCYRLWLSTEVCLSVGLCESFWGKYYFYYS